MSEILKNPTLAQGQYGIGFAEVMTGIVLQTNGERYNGSGDCFVVFNSLQEAKKFAEKKVAETPSIECSIYDDKGVHFECIKDHEYITRYMQSAKENKKK